MRVRGGKVAGREQSITRSRTRGCGTGEAGAETAASVRCGIECVDWCGSAIPAEELRQPMGWINLEKVRFVQRSSYRREMPGIGAIWEYQNQGYRN